MHIEFRRRQSGKFVNTHGKTLNTVVKDAVYRSAYTYLPKRDSVLGGVEYCMVCQGGDDGLAWWGMQGRVGYT